MESQDSSSSTWLPPPIPKDDTFIPPTILDSQSSPTPPTPPPKVIDFDLTSQTISSEPPQLDSLPSFGSFDPGLSIPLALTLPSTPSSSTPPSPSSEVKPKKSNPFLDLIETERVYVDQLTGVIRKIAAAWSRSNLPPPELDTMFRAVEGVYKANRTLLSKLKDIGPNPSSAKALGDLLMRWIDDLEGPYTSYCLKYCTGFDTWEPVQSNPKLQTVLSTYSAINTPPSHDGSAWTLDALFILPKIRLKYYKKLYGRLLKITTPGRSDHKLLSGAMTTLEQLLNIVETREHLQVGSQSSAPPPIETQDEVVVSMGSVAEPKSHSPARTGDTPVTPGSTDSSTRGSLQSGGERLSRETATTSVSRGSTQTPPMSASDLERRLATDRTLDIFTMTPKMVRLHMSPPSLPYKRELRFSADVTISFTPRSTGIETVHYEGHIFLLTDLFLIAERMSPEERAQAGPDGPDMWLCYPPLAGKVLRISEIPAQENSLQVNIMKKETLTLQLESVQQRDFMIAQFTECIDFASTRANAKSSAPPVPSLNGLPQVTPQLPRSPSAPLPNSRGPTTENLPPPPGPSNGNVGFSPHRTSSEYSGPLNGRRSYDRGLPPVHHSQYLADGMSNLSLGQEGQYQPTPRNHVPQDLMFPPRSAPVGQQFSIGPGQIFGQRNVNVGAPPIPGPPLAAGPGPQLHPSRQNHHNVNPSQYPRPGEQSHNNGFPPGTPSDPQFQGGLRKTPSLRSLGSSSQNYTPPLPPPPANLYSMRTGSYETLHTPQPRPLLPSAQMSSRVLSMAVPNFQSEPSPPPSPIEESVPVGPVTNTVSAQMKCKVFLQQQHAQWKSLGTAKLKLYLQLPTNVKQLVVEADNKDKTTLISTIVLTDGVERVGKTGVAIELSNKGARTGIIYMIQLRNETSAGGLFDSLLAGSDRSTG